MKKVVIYAAMAAMIVTAGVSFTGCKGTKQVATTSQQKAALGRGVKMEKEECEEMAMKATKRASGIGSSQSERLAKNTAALDARTNLLAALQSIIVGMIKNFDQEHQAGANMQKTSDFVNQSGEEQKALLDGVISSRIICSNTYAQEDGSYKVYVCVEMTDESIGSIYKKLSQDKKISIQFEEDRFRKEMEKGLEDFRNRE
ncbi:MAG: hypothetical protein LBR08_08535 [Bacteroidales bacterium]|jgi:hypothetical protein|nr:hypothetical protein [Bacteroidales bacterium]